MRDIDLNSFDSLISSVEQNSQYYELPIKENAALSSFDSYIDEEKVHHVLEAVMLDEKIESLPKGIDNEAKIFDLIYSLCKAKTLILISHKLSCVKDVDRILVMDNGIIAEEGNHASLMQQNGKYAEMFKTQSERYGV